MKLIIIITSFLFQLPAVSQKNLLDKIKGTANIHIGDPMKKFEPFLMIIDSLASGARYLYLTPNKTDYNIFGKSADSIFLSFDRENRVSVIDLTYDYKKNNYTQSLEDFSEILKTVKKKYGSPSLNLSRIEDKNSCFAWSGSNLQMMIGNGLFDNENSSRNTITFAAYLINGLIKNL